jgi:HK97 family phage prohead protease
MTHALERDLTVCTRSYNFELRSVGRNGRRLVGTVAMFHKRTRIPDRNGDFEENLHPGFMARSLKELGVPIMQFDHGKCPRTGTVPIGRYDIWDETRTGYDVEGDLFDNQLVEPIRQAIEGRAIKGMSFRFQVSKNGDRWERRNGGMDLRHVLDADVPEAGPVVFPAYRDTRVAVRSILATFDDEELAEAIRELRAMAGLATDLTGEPSTWSGGRGDPDAQPREGEAPNPAQLARIRALRTLRTVLP